MFTSSTEATSELTNGQAPEITLPNQEALLGLEEQRTLGNPFQTWNTLGLGWFWFC